MPACTSTDVITPVHDALELALGTNGGGGSSVKDVDTALIASARKALLDSSNQLQFVPARQSYSTVQEALKEKYTWLGSGSQQDQAGNSQKEHMGLLNGKDQSKESRGALDDGIPQPRIVIFNADRIDMKWPTMQPARVGLTNMGNTCFLNSTLQCLVFTAPMANYLLTGGHAQECKVNGFCMLCEMQHLLRKCIGPQASATTVQPLSILQKIKMIAKNMSWGRQEDAHEFLRYVIDAMQKTCQFGYPNLDVHSKQTTVVSQIFGGYLRSQVRCLQCRTPSDTYDPFLDISIDIKNASSVERALQKFVQPEILDVDNAYHCTKCCQKVRAQKRFTIHRVPKVLTIQLKRFDYHRQMGGKVSKHVEFTEKLNLRPFTSKHEGEALVYQLYAVLVHSGHSCNSGHYYCYVRAPNHSWYCMNDSSVSQASLARVLAAEAYILFYARTHQMVLPGKPQQLLGAAVPSAALSSPASTAGGAAGSSTPGVRLAAGPVAAAKPTFLASLAASDSETSSAKCVNGPRTLDGGSLSSKVAFSLTSAHNSPSDRPRIILHNPKKSLPGLSAQPLSALSGIVRQPAASVASSLAGGSAQNQLRPLVPYKDEEDCSSAATGKEAQSTASAATVQTAPAATVQTAPLSVAAGSSVAITGPRHGHACSARDSTSSSSSSGGDRERKPGCGTAPVSGVSSSRHTSPPAASMGSPSAAARPIVNATANNWHVVDDAGVRPSSARSERSSTSGSGTSVNSTQEWNVQLTDSAAAATSGWCKQQPKLSMPPVQPASRSHTGWLVTADRGSSDPVDACAVKQVSPVERPSVSASGGLSCSAFDSGTSSGGRDKLPRPSLLSPLSGGSKEDAGSGDGKSVGVHQSKVSDITNSAGTISVTAPAAVGSHGCEGRSGSGGEVSKRNCDRSSSTNSACLLRSADSPSTRHDEQSDESRKKRKKKKHKKHKRASPQKEVYRQDDTERSRAGPLHRGSNGTLGDNDDSRKRWRQSHSTLGDSGNVASQTVREEDRRRKKHKKRRHSRSDDDDSSSSEQWVEITKANLADRQLLGQATANGHMPVALACGSKPSTSDSHRAHNGSGDQARNDRVPLGPVSEVKQLPKWDGTKKSSVTHLLERHSIAGYGASVSSWDGSKSQLNREAEEERKASRKRTWHDEYEEELDRGRIKKVKSKSEKRDYSPDYNRLQRLQDIRNHSSGKPDKWRHDQTAGKSGSRTAAY